MQTLFPFFRGRTFTYMQQSLTAENTQCRESITVQLVSSLSSLDTTSSLHTNNHIFFFLAKSLPKNHYPVYLNICKTFTLFARRTIVFDPLEQNTVGILRAVFTWCSHWAISHIKLVKSVLLCLGTSSCCYLKLLRSQIKRNISSPSSLYVVGSVKKIFSLTVYKYKFNLGISMWDWEHLLYWKI